MCYGGFFKIIIFCFLSVIFLSSVSFSEDLSLKKKSKVKAYVFPIMAYIRSSKYGMRRHPITKKNRMHSGVDLAAPMNTPVRVITSGKVVFAGSYAGYGKLVTVMHKDGLISMYGHLNEILTNLGEELEAGQIIGRVGSTGISTGPHLHFELRKNNKTLDPEKMFPGLKKKAQG